MELYTIDHPAPTPNTLLAAVRFPIVSGKWTKCIGVRFRVTTSAAVGIRKMHVGLFWQSENGLTSGYGCSALANHDINTTLSYCFAQGLALNFDTLNVQANNEQVTAPLVDWFTDRESFAMITGFNPQVGDQIDQIQGVFAVGDLEEFRI